MRVCEAGTAMQGNWVHSTASEAGKARSDNLKDSSTSLAKGNHDQQNSQPVPYGKSLRAITQKTLPAWWNAQSIQAAVALYFPETMSVCDFSKVESDLCEAGIIKRLRCQLRLLRTMRRAFSLTQRVVEDVNLSADHQISRWESRFVVILCKSEGNTAHASYSAL